MTVFIVAKPIPSQSDLWKMFNYHSDGYLIWKTKPAQNINIGDRAGAVNKRGYTEIRVNGFKYLAHRLIYQFFEGNLLPTDVVDHVEKTKRNELKDNRIENLRKTSPSGNSRNTGVRVDSESGIKGVSWNSEREKYVAQISVSRKVENLGRFTNKFDAYTAYRKRCLEVDPVSYADNSKDMRPDILIEYQEYLLQKQSDIFKLAA